MEKKYRTKSGLPARIICTDRQHPSRPIIALLSKEGMEDVQTYTKDLKFWSDGDSSDYDLVEGSPYEDIPIDTQGYFWNVLRQHAAKGHFAGLDEEGNPNRWKCGATSFTSNIRCAYLHFEPAED